MAAAPPIAGPEPAFGAVQRRLSAVLAADAVSFSAKLERDATGTVGALIECRRLMGEVATRTGGRLVAAPGDFLLAEFASASSAADAALGFVRAIAERNSAVPSSAALQYRIGLGLGDLIETDGDIVGTAINIAARLQQVARPQQILVPTVVRETVKERQDLRFKDLGLLRLKHIATPTRVYELRERDDRSDVVAAHEPSATDVGEATANTPSIVFRGFRALGHDERCHAIGASLGQMLTATIVSLAPRITLYETEPAAELQPCFDLTGTVDVATEAVITVKLAQHPQGRTLWAHQFATEPERRLDVQTEIVRAVVAALQIALTEGEQARFWHASTRSLAAWENFQRGKDLERQFRRESHRRARASYEAALLEDPGFVSAIAALAFCHLDEARLGWSETQEESLLIAEALAGRAATLGVESADLHTLAAFLHLLRGRHDRALAAARRAAGMAPRSAEVAAYVGAIHRGIGAFEAAIEWYRRAQTLSPVREIWIDGNIANVLLLQGRDAAALQIYRDVIGRDADYLAAHVGATAALARLGDAERAREHARRVRLIDPLFEVARWSQRFSGVDPQHLRPIVAALRKAGLD